MIRYLGISQFATDLIFVWFMLSWLVTRHILFLFVIKSTVLDAPGLISFGWDAVAGHYVTKEMYFALSVLLLALQVDIPFNHLNSAEVRKFSRLCKSYGSG